MAAPLVAAVGVAGGTGEGGASFDSGCMNAGYLAQSAAGDALSVA